jgi:hypothetical protein
MVASLTPSSGGLTANAEYARAMLRAVPSAPPAGNSR